MSADGDQVMRSLRERHPRFLEAITADARVTLTFRGEPVPASSLGLAIEILRLAVVSDAFLGQVLYRLKARLQALGVPLLPRIAHRLAMATAQVSIGDPVVIAPGIYIAHGQVVVDGFVEVGPGVVLFPFVTIGLQDGHVRGPILRASARIGTGAKVIGPVTVGEEATVGANAVVLDDVPAGSTVVGAPARVVGQRAGDAGTRTA
jgi:serine O-acetyltransferase